MAVELCQTSLRVSWDNVFVHHRSLRQDIPGDEMRGCSTPDVACLPYKPVRTTPRRSCCVVCDLWADDGLLVGGDLPALAALDDPWLSNDHDLGRFFKT